MSLSTLNRNFIEATGLSPIDYLIRIRVLRGADMLREGAGSVSEVAFAVGFNDSNYFSRQFRKIMGETPSRYWK
jgi:transcriptional regulator GlxA family with amidase domain